MGWYGCLYILYRKDDPACPNLLAWPTHLKGNIENPKIPGLVECENGAVSHQIKVDQLGTAS